VQYLDLMTYLPDDINTKVDRASMAHSLEVRPPLLDHRLVEYVLSLPGDTRMGEREQKALLRSSVGDLIPTEVLTRPKQGFVGPLQTWLEREGEWARDFIAGGELIRQGVLSRGVFSLPGRGKSPARMWALLVLEEWFRRQVS
jgi:asparagine synthase (glutamine-hydrolysing)